MYLKSIEVHGFKSFANKLKFQFHNGITGIVGPNGSGKSNVGDAVRWVLGEQSAKQLRGSNMQDVIFSGTENRKPLGFASVAITLDNSDHALPTDYEEVTVTRRLYRSGESEYLLNGTNCRLKDINELFYDTGIGKEGYSIIGQGQIDKILNGKPEERRELFDEAAGIVKFKRRKLTAQKKLEDESNNLTRVNDILSEITRQVGPLERQSEKARIYLQKKEELKTLDINMFLLEGGRIEQQMQEVAEKTAISDHDIAEAKKNLENARNEYELAEKQIEELDELLAAKRNEISQGKIVKQQLESQIELLREQIRSSEANEGHYQSRLSSIDGEIAAKETAKSREEAELQKEKDSLAQMQGREEEMEQLLMRMTGEAAELEQRIAEGQARVIDLLNSRASTKTRLQRYDTMTEQIEIRRAELTGRLLTARGEEDILLENRRQIQEEYEAVAENIRRIIEKNSGIEAGIQEIQQELVKKSQELEEARNAYHREASRLESLRNITERYDGYGMSIRKVMEQKKTVSGLHGVVADLIKTEKKYETAVETALGGSIQNIVTDNETTAKRMIDFLKKNRFGRATFLPLTAIRRRGGLSREQALYEPGALGVASTLVETDDVYEELVEYLLGQTLVVDQIDHAIAIARKYRQSIRIVTLDGELLSPGGSMSGGAYKNAGNLLGRRRETEELEKTVEKQKKRLEETQNEGEKLRDRRTALREELVAQTELLQKEYIKQNTAKLKLEEIQTQEEKSESANEQLRSEAAELDAQIREIRAEQEMIQKELAEADAAQQKLEQEALENQARRDEKKLEQDRQNEQTMQLRTSVAALREKTEFAAGNVLRLSGELAALSKEKEELLKLQQGFGTEISEKQSQIDVISQNIAHAVQAEAEVAAETEELQEKRRQLSRTHKDFFNRREELAQHMSALDKERFRLDNQKERLVDYQERQISYMWEEYGLTASEAENYRSGEHENASLLKKQIGELKNAIKALGPVNVNAIEEYKETKERYEFLSAQHTDLVKAGEALKSIISELDAGMRRQFTEQFALIQTEFSKAFKELFGGGHGSLELVEDEDILEAGIRIIAQPPGKKLVNMMQMSGGEKALTAIALLFAIQNLKPSPFCLLDEIEAALDENNVARYAGYLKKLTKSTQFIIITHRRGTMAAADRLYGITMQEKGVSTQVSVNMLEDELDQ